MTDVNGARRVRAARASCGDAGSMRRAGGYRRSFDVAAAVVAPLDVR